MIYLWQKSVLGYMSATGNAVSSIVGGNVVGGLTDFASSSANALLDTYGTTKNYDLDLKIWKKCKKKNVDGSQ